MNLDDLKKTLSELKDEMEKGLSSTEQYTAFKENLDKLRAAAKKNPFIATISEVIINPISKELDRAYKKFSEKTARYDGFDLVNDPKAMDKVRQYLETVEATHASMDPAQLAQSLDPLIKVVEDLDHINPETTKEEEFADDLRRRVIKLKLSAARPQSATTKSPTTLVFRYHQTPFNITSKNFANDYRAYMEDVAINAAAKDVQQLLEIGQVLNIIAEDLTQTQAESPDEEKFLHEVNIQTPLLLKIVDRQITLKSSALAQFHKRAETPQVIAKADKKQPKSAPKVAKKVAKKSASKAQKTTKASKTVAKKAAVKKAVKKSAKSAEKATKPKKVVRS